MIAASLAAPYIHARQEDAGEKQDRQQMQAVAVALDKQAVDQPDNSEDEQHPAIIGIQADWHQDNNPADGRDLPRAVFSPKPRDRP